MLIIKFFRTIQRQCKLNGLLGLLQVWRMIVNKIYSWLFLRKYHIHADTSCYINGLKYMEIGSLRMGRYNWLEIVTGYKGQQENPLLKIGNNVSLSFKCHIGCAKYVEIGDNCVFGSNVYLTDHNHGWYRGENQSDISVPPVQRDLGCEEVVLGKNVWVGENVVILPGSHIGDNAIIGANSVVHGDIPANTIAVGSPAKVVKMWNEESKKWERV